MKVLNLYAGIGGNRKLWPKECRVVAVENNKEIAKIYKDFFPKDKVIVTDAHKQLLEHYKEFDFIWSSPPCPTHSHLRRIGVQAGNFKPLYPDMRIYEEIIFLKHFFKGKWVVENVKSYYNPLVKPQIAGRHYFWANFNITNKKMQIEIPQNRTGNIKNFSKTDKVKMMEFLDMKYDKNIYIGKNHDPAQLFRNAVHPKLGLHIFNCAFKEKQETLR